MIRPNMVIFRHEGKLCENALTYGGNLIGPASTFDNPYYEESLKDNQLMYVVYNQQDQTSNAISSFSLTDNEKNEPASITSIIEKGQIEEVVLHFFETLINDLTNEKEAT